MPTISNDRRGLLLGILLLVIALGIMLLFSAALPGAEHGHEEEPFAARAERFAAPVECHAWLSGTVQAAAGAVAARGPYPIGPGDVRAHRILLAEGGHRITEWRCLGAALSERSWTDDAPAGGEVAPFTMDDLNAMKF